MTRLTTSDIDTISVTIHQYDCDLKEKVGFSLAEIAMHAVGLDQGDVIAEEKNSVPLISTPKYYKTAVIPVTTGLGIIDGFSESVCDILRHIGVDAFVTKKSDVAGLQEAYDSGAEIVFLADDDTTSAFSISHRAYSDNGYGTGIGYAAALELSMRNRNQHNKRGALVMGLGPVGQAAVSYLTSKNINVSVYDIDSTKSSEVQKIYPDVHIIQSSLDIKHYKYMLDATPVGDVIGITDVSEDTMIAAPGVPLGVTKEAAKIAQVIHNPLELGIITMYYDVVSKILKS